MATGGSGDVLSGVIGALAGQGLSCFEAAACGVYIHGAAGDIAAKALGEYGIIASDIAAMMGLAIQKITGS
jgi:NAD(P)H-hydrate epimerase